MGAYLDKPITDKNSSHGSLYINGQECPYAQTAMQGWRAGMENDSDDGIIVDYLDSYMIIPKFDERGPLLGVFDGHGGREVAMYCSKYFPDILSDSKCYQDGDVTRGLSQAFMNCDRKLLTPEVITELKTMSENNDIPVTDEANEEELEQLSREADMPIENVLRACMEDKKLLKYMVNVANREENDESSEEEEESSDDEETSIEEAQRSKLYTKFIKELTSQYRPALNELQEYMMNNDDSSDDDSSDDDEEDDDTLNNETAAVNVVSSSTDSMILRKRTRTDLESDSCSSKRLKLKDGEQINCNTKEENEKLEDGKEEGEVNCDTNEEEDNEQEEKEENDTEEEKEEGVELKDKGTAEVYKDPEGFESGTTATVCLIRKETIFVANAGDSRCILSCNGEAVDLSLDHKPVDPIERHRIEKAGGHVDEDLRVDGGLNMSRAIGDHMYKLNNQLSLEEQMITAYPDVLTRDMSSNDEFLVLASDGIWNCMDSQEVIQFIRKKLINISNTNNNNIDSALSSICEELCDACLAEDIDNDGTGCDNMTVILTLLKPLDKLFKKPL